MDDPFADVRRRREELEAAEVERAREAESARKLQLERRAEAHRKYDELVMQVLSQLQQAAYPQYRARNYGETWSVGCEGYRSWEDGNMETWNSKVTVRLEFDRNDHAVGFTCSIGSSTRKADLNRDALIKALRACLPKD